MLLATTPEAQKYYIDSLAVSGPFVNVLFDSLNSRAISPEVKNLLERTTNTRKTYRDIRIKYVDMVKSNSKEDAYSLLNGELKKVHNEYTDGLYKLLNIYTNQMHEKVQQVTEEYNNARIMIIIIVLISIIISILTAVYVTKQITKPLNQAVDASNNISKGNLKVNLDSKSKDETGMLLGAMKVMSGNIDSLVKELNEVSEAASQGNLDRRANESNFEGEYKNIMIGFNKTLDAVIGPLNVTAEYVDRISKGDIPPRITDEYKGDFNEIKNNLNQCIDSVNLLVNDSLMLAKAASEGKLYTRANATKHNGDFKAIVDGVNKTLNTLVGFFDTMPVPAMIIDNEFNILYMNNAGSQLDNSTGKELVNSKCYNFFKTGDCQSPNCACDIAMKSKNNAKGNTLAKPGRLNLDIEYYGVPILNDKGESIGAFEIVLNQTDIKKAMRLQDKISVYQKEETEKVIKNLIELSKGNTKIVAITGEGDAELNEVKEKYESINEAFNDCVRTINSLLDERDEMNKQHELGHISYHMPVDKFQGAFATMVDGINTLVQSHIDVKMQVVKVVTEYAKGNLAIDIDRLPGEKAKITNAIDFVKANMLSLNDEILMLVDAAKAGQLSTRGNISKYQYSFKDMVEGINNILDGVTVPIDEAADVLVQMATGDLTVRMIGDYQGDLSKLKNDINTLGDSLSQLINQVNDAVQNTASAALEISSTAEGLAASSQEQSAQTDEVASAVEEMSRTVAENAQSATRTAEVAHENGEVASQGAQVVKQTVAKMRDIASVVKNSAQNIQKLGDSSKQIGEIISVIDDIADQTNLLAINATIEAARAGEQGRGFAVVADEVRKLAERTTDATKKIASMIKGIQSETEMAVTAMNQGTVEVQSGIEYADKAGESLNEILSSTQEVLDMINQIAAASEEQSATSEQISKNVMSISKVATESSQRIEDVAHTSDELAKLTEQLKNLMGNFQVDDGGAYSTKHLVGRPQRQLY